jgi:molybdopterin-guanine dinucleotide biosynthesis protein A
LAKEIKTSGIRCQPVADFSMAERNKIAYVLAGGQSRRLGTDKLSLIIDGMSLLERTTAKCAASFDQVRLVAPKVGSLSELGYPVVQDSSRASGPMAGVIAALEDCSTDTCFVTAADLLDLRTEVIMLLVSRYRGQQYFGLREQRSVQPLCGIYQNSALAVLCARAGQGQFGMAAALKEMDTDTVALPPGRWRNINWPEDLSALEGCSG